MPLPVLPAEIYADGWAAAALHARLPDVDLDMALVVIAFPVVWGVDRDADPVVT
jgi:hypothetical protein